jgi:hypothetical protein
MLDELGGIRQEIRNLRADLPVKRPAGRVDVYILSNTGNTQRRQIPVEGHITGLFIGGDQSGRGTLQIGTVQYPFWVIAYTTTFWQLQEDDQLVIKNDTVTWNPPGLTGNWDVILMCHAR